MRLSEKITEKLRMLDNKKFDLSGNVNPEQKKALINAERLADKYQDVKPNSYHLPNNYLFKVPEENNLL